MGKVDLGAVDFAVQEEGVGSQNESSHTKNDGKGSGGSTGRTATGTTHGGNVPCCFFQSRQDGVDVIASRRVSVEVLLRAQSGLALGGHLVRRLAQLNNLVVVVIVVITIVVVSVCRAGTRQISKKV